MLFAFNITASAEVSEPSGYRNQNYDAPVPETLTGAKVITAPALKQLQAHEPVVVIDVYPAPRKPKKMRAGAIWRPPPHQTVPGAVWLPFVGLGRLCPALEHHFQHQLRRLSEADPERALVFFCRMDCWLSWNAAKRALALGYRNVYWFRDGMDDWLWEQFPTVNGTPVPWPECER